LIDKKLFAILISSVLIIIEITLLIRGKLLLCISLIPASLFVSFYLDRQTKKEENE